MALAVILVAVIPPVANVVLIPPGIIAELGMFIFLILKLQDSIESIDFMKDALTTPPSYFDACIDYQANSLYATREK